MTLQTRFFAQWITFTGGIVLGIVLLTGLSHAGHLSSTNLDIVIAEQAVTWAIFVDSLLVSHAYTHFDRKLGRTGVPGTAKILRRRVGWTGQYTGNVQSWRYQVEVSLPGHPSYQTTMMHWQRFDEGTTISIRAGRHNRKRVAFDPNPAASPAQATQTFGFSRDASESSSGTHVELLPNGGQVPFPVSPSTQPIVARVNTGTGPVATATAGPGDVADELSKLSDLHRQGVLSDDEFARAKSKLLSQ